jgi:CrcB protein
LAGFLGGFTTFSAYALQTFVFLRNEQLWLAAIIMLASNLGGLVMVWIGYSVSKAM